MFAIVLFPSLSQSLRGHICEIWARAMRNVINCVMVGVFLPKGDFDYHFESMIWNGSDANYIVIVYESNNLPFVVVIGCGCCWHMGMRTWIGSVILQSLRHGEKAFFYSNWNLTSLSANISSFERLVPIFTGHLLVTIGHCSTYFFLPPLTMML